MTRGQALEHDSDTVRYVSGLGALPTWIRAVDGFAPELVAAAIFVALVVWLFWLW